MGIPLVRQWKRPLRAPLATKDEEPVPVTIAALTRKDKALAGGKITFVERLASVSGNRR
jgi:hypothetical protein